MKEETVMRRLLIVVLLLAFGMPVAFAQSAPDFPARTVRLIVGLAPGGNPDTFARLAANALQQQYHQQFIVENRPGASSNLAADAVVKAAPDGYTLLVGSSGIYTINPQIYASMPFDPFRDLAPVALSVATTMWLVVHPSVPVSSVAELISYARSQPRPLAYASSGNG